MSSGLQVAPAVQHGQPQRQKHAQGWRRWPAHLALGLVWVVWVYRVTPGMGGRELAPLLEGLAALVPAFVVLRPWRVVPAAVMVLPGLACVGGLVVLTVTPMRWAHADEIAWSLAGAPFIPLVISYATSSRRQVAVALGLLGAGVAQFGQALVPWWGGQDPNSLMFGTFYWHNPFAAYLLGIGVVAMALFLRGPRVAVVPGFLVASLCAAGILFSTSRTCLGLLAVAWLLLVPHPREFGRRLLVRWMSVPLGAVVVVGALTGPWLFSRPYHWFLFGSQAQHTANGRGLDTVGGNGAARWLFTKSALQSWLGDPLQGRGFGSFRYTVVEHVPAGYGISPFVHDGPVDWLTSGGLIFAAPLLIGLVLLARRWVPGVLLGPGAGGDGLRRGVAVALAVLTVHSCVDFDWTHPSLSALYGVLAGLMLASSIEEPMPGPAPQQSHRLLRAGGALGLAITLLVTGLTAVGDGQGRHRGHVPADPTLRAMAALKDAGGWLPDPEPAAQAAESALPDLASGSRSLRIPAPLARRLLSATGLLARIDPPSAMARAALEVGLGNVTQGEGMAEDVASASAAHRPYLYGELAIIEAMGGNFEQARWALDQERHRASPPGAADTQLGAQVTAVDGWLSRVSAQMPRQD